MTNWVGERMGRLLIVARTTGPRADCVYWRCRCDCGNEHVVTAHNLRSKNTLSCGCWQREVARDQMFRHGLHDSREYETWQRLIQRCTNPTNPSYKHYGGRGITVCPEWLDDFTRFFADMGPRPQGDYSIDRVNNEGPYSAANCRWATRIEQAWNKRTVHLIDTPDGPLPPTIYGPKHGLHRALISARLKRGWSLERAASTPAGQNGPKRRH